MLGIYFLYRHLHIWYILFIPNEKGVKLSEGGGWTDKHGSVFFHFSKAINLWKYDNSVKVVTKDNAMHIFFQMIFGDIACPFLVCCNDQSDTGCPRKISFF